MVTHDRRLAAAAAALLVLATACGRERPAQHAAERRSATPLTSGASCPGTNVHERHINLFACATCHPAGGILGFTVPFTFPGGTTTAGGTIVPGDGTTPTTCAVACHHPDGAARTVAWASGPLACTSCHDTAALPGTHPPMAADAPRAECERCHATSGHLEGAVVLASHPASWRDPTSAGFHAHEANRGLADCKVCHGSDLAGGPAGVGCGQCHDQTTPTLVSWKDRCTLCHGGGDNSTGAPPRATWGNGADPVRIGAHSKHLASAIAPAFGCAICHVQPSDALSSGHVDGGTAEVVFSGTGAIDTAAHWSRSAGSCTNTYCHARPGASTPAPAWTGALGGEGACGACHGAPPPAPHPLVALPAANCIVCHDATLDAQGAIIPASAGGRHLDGVVQSTGHLPSWMDRTSEGFHAGEANRGLAPCAQCHGANLDGVGAPVTTIDCGTCHGGSGWSTSCTMCHGGSGDSTGAPPRATWGNAADPIRTGAHAAHVRPTAIAPASDCTVCHLKPGSAFTPGHLDASSVSEVVFGGRAIGTVTPTWDRGLSRCESTRCHAGGGGTNPTPTWTRVGQGETACGTCHGLPPPGPHPTVDPALTACASCHVESMRSDGVVIAPTSGGKHLDGIIQAGGHISTWMDTTSSGFHANAAADGLDACRSCHGTSLDGAGGIARGCQTCHGDGWRTNCVLCHGGTDNQTGAPPRTVWGKGADLLRVGAHTAHLTPSTMRTPIACATCHPVPEDALGTGHIDAREIADVRLTGIATIGTTAAWNRTTATCTTYCHGATLPDGINTAPVWTGGPSQAACDSCHGAPPSTGQHWHAPYGSASCEDCHGFEYASNHLNGRIDVAVGWDPATGSCIGCHGYAYW